MSCRSPSRPMRSSRNAALHDGCILKSRDPRGPKILTGRATGCQTNRSGTQRRVPLGGFSDQSDQRENFGETKVNELSRLVGAAPAG